MPTAIKFENISKQYRLGLVSTRTLSHDLNRWWQMNILRREDPYLQIGEVNDRAHKGNSEYVWALKDINFEVEQGDVVGIIGKNGAGKSTLLKILSKVTVPTTGNIKAKGRIASLLEVGTGFHPEMTGRENIYMNGAIMGMRKSEIDRKFDEIVDFAGVERYIDTPVKRYSSGMTVRLGFAVAAFLEPEILVVDEVLAVGDAEFQKKAIGKMQDVSRGEGRTVLFVSHNMAAITDLCTRGILLNNGGILIDNNIKSVVKEYLSSTNTISSQRIWNGSECPGNQYIKIRKVYFIDSNNNQIDFAFINQKFGFCIEYEVTEDVPFFTHGINVFNNIETHLFTSHDGNSYEGIKTIKQGKYKITSWIPANLLQSDTLDFSFACMRYNPFEILFHEMQLARINIIEAMNALTRNENHRGDLPGIIRPKLDWSQRIEIFK